MVHLVSQGKTTEEIAEILDVHERTIGTEREKIATITDTHSVAEMLMWAIRQGVVKP